MTSRSRVSDADGSSEAEVDELLRTLADARCRHLLGYLSATDDRTVPVEDAAAHVAAATDDPRDSTRIALYHHHLPKCDAADLVEYDPDERAVRYEGDPLAEEVLDAVSEVTDASY